ncbi:hypothetical protein [Sinorhizobium psoraleae]|uniref:Uncharacterized protein n=1 Tax=Sinorhizobium psoraleae TaxID=520838 RepID=A0ABT4KR18_9HYPH|nr:hypothetical protein [Sinorhizobium psoraleae]MCZ4093736.1 hypothetical protein [Sinorhizobium psoraleae]
MPINLFQAFSEGKAHRMRRAWKGSRIVPLAWYRQAWEEQREILNDDPWAYRLDGQNRRTRSKRSSTPLTG